MPAHEEAREEQCAPAELRTAGTITASLQAGVLTPSAVLALQRTAGNGAVVGELRRRGQVSTGEAAQKLRSARAGLPGSRAAPGTRFRVPTAEELKKIYSSGILDEADVEAAIRRALRRMDFEWELRTDAEDVMKSIFPGGGVFDEAKAASIFGTSKRRVYTSFAEAESKLTPGDKAKLADVAEAAMREMDNAMNDKYGLDDVFGSKAGVAKERYRKGKAALAKAIKNADKAIDADYNRDDPQVNLGGWANYDSQHIHLTGDVAEVKDRTAAIITLIHESMHLSHPDVDDHGYYGTPGFEAMPEKVKINNAAHYEELPARSLGVSRYAIDPAGVIPGYQTFRPGVTKGGSAMTFEDHVRRDASEHMRKAWDAAVDAHGYIRGVAVKIQNKPKGGDFAANRKSLLALSQMEQLTIHKQKPKPYTITTLDVVLSEGVARGVAIVGSKVKKQPAPSGTDRKAAVDTMIDGAIAAYGELLGNAIDDRKLIDWLVKHYRKGF